MSYRCSRSGYTVRVDGSFARHDTFVIQARLAYAAGLSELEREMVASRAEMELFLAIAGESERGRDRGARTVCLSVDGTRPAEIVLPFPSRRPTPTVAH